ncbi:MAG: alpha-2-macroglobulin family protein, partial [Bacteroidetes bacterium]|nr:alpha-2-macroglobulin family protein [Bacteroidota bacterium]
KTFTKTLNEEGSVDANFSTLKESLTGVYSIFVYTSNNVLLASKNVMVEEFMPDRIKVNTTVNKEQYTINDQNIELSVTAQNLFGPPAANRNYEVELNYKTRYFYAKDYANYDFYILNTNRYFESELRQGKTDASGQAKETFKLDKEFENMGLLQADIFTTVFDETGRPVNRKNSVEIYTQDIFYGIGYFDYYLATNSEIKMPLIAVNKDGKSVNSKANIKVIKHEYQTVLNKTGSYFRYESNKIEKTLVNKEIAINGPTNFKFVPNVSGEYEVRIYKPGEKDRYVSQYFYAYGYGNTYLSSFEVDNEGKVTMETDKETYEVGDKAKILFNTPFQGKMLVTVEGKDVLDYYYVNTDKRSASLTIDITEEFLPNVYISATLIKPHQTTEFP